ncbi:MAG: restriction endonuclease [Muribaculaceae bacterium]|nr:restriction endonuclease [Muribaculaceae bacterium]
MNLFTKISIDLANQRNYLDQLFRVYPLAPDSIRTISKRVWQEIEDSYNNGDNEALFRALLKLKLFPIKDSYVPYFRKDKTAIKRNPQTVNRICGRVRELGLNELYERVTEPINTNSQVSPLFKRWIDSGVLGVIPCDPDQFIATNDNAILKGSDASLKEFAASHLGFTHQVNKGIDFIGRFNHTYVIGVAKFFADEEEHPNGQFLDAMTILKTRTRSDVKTVAILDGVLYIPGKENMYHTITSQDVNVMSTLLLREFLYSL